MLDNLNRRQILIIIGLILIIIYLLLTLVDIKEVYNLLVQADWREMLPGIFLLLLGYVLISVRTRYMLGNKPSFLNTLKVDSSGLMLSVLMQVPHPAYRIVAINKTSDIELSQATSAMVVNFLASTVLRILVLILAVFLLIGNFKENGGTLFAGAGLLAILLAVLFGIISRGDQAIPLIANMLKKVPRISEERASITSEKMVGGLAQAGSPGRFFVTFLLTLGIWLCTFGFYYLTIDSYDLQLRDSYFLVALAAMVIAPPSSPLMVGVFHGLLIASLVGLRLMDSEIATAYAIILHGVQMLILIVLGAWGLASLDMNLKEVLAETRNRANHAE